MPQGPIPASIARSFQKFFTPGLIGQQGDLWESNRHGKYYNATYGTPAITSPATAAKAGTNFRGSNSASQALSSALTAAYTGLCLSNPAASTVNLVVHKVSWAMVAAPSNFLGIGLITGWLAAGITAHTVSLNANIVNGYVGAATSGGSILMAAPQANLDSQCTLVGTPAWDRWLTANAATGGEISGTFDLDDDLIIPPGGYVAIGANAAGPAGFFGTWGWEELAP